MIPKLKRQNK